MIDSVSFITSPSPISLLAQNHQILLDYDIESDHRLSDTLQKLMTSGIEFEGRKITSIEDYNRVKEIIKAQTPPNIAEMVADIKQLAKPSLQKLLIWHRKTFGHVC